MLVGKFGSGKRQICFAMVNILHKFLFSHPASTQQPCACWRHRPANPHGCCVLGLLFSTAPGEFLTISDAGQAVAAVISPTVQLDFLAKVSEQLNKIFYQRRNKVRSLAFTSM
jgi:hypothetical protein